MWFRAPDGVRLYGIEAGAGRTVVVLAHEGGADLCGWLTYIKTLNRAGIRAFAFDFRGYGNSDRPAEGSLALGRDLAGAVAQVRADGAKHIFLMGASMGGAAVVQNTADIRVDGLISLSGTRLWTGYGVNDPAGVRSLSAPFLYVGTRDDSRALRKKPSRSSRASVRPTSGSSSIRARLTAPSWSRCHRTDTGRAHSSSAGSRNEADEP
jgi:pimeloyl-ACP methyl ester carboxylesterase